MFRVKSKRVKKPTDVVIQAELIFDPENGKVMFLRNVKVSPKYQDDRTLQTGS
jgi:hypothetical protein